MNGNYFKGKENERKWSMQILALICYYCILMLFIIKHCIYFVYYQFGFYDVYRLYRVKRYFEMQQLRKCPNHVAIITDDTLSWKRTENKERGGNDGGQWEKLLKFCNQTKIKYLTFYENGNLIYRDFLKNNTKYTIYKDHKLIYKPPPSFPPSSSLNEDNGDNSDFTNDPSGDNDDRVKIMFCHRNQNQYFMDRIKEIERERSEPVTMEFINSFISPFPQIDLLIIKSWWIQIKGLLPWHIGNSELIHQPLVNWSNPLTMKYALLCFNEREQRFGK